MNNLKKTVVAIVAFGAGGGAAYTANHHYECSGYEQDVLNAIDSMVRASQLGGLDSTNPELVATAKKLDEIANRDGEAAMNKLSEECGERALKTAMRKANAAVGY